MTLVISEAAGEQLTLQPPRPYELGRVEVESEQRIAPEEVGIPPELAPAEIVQPKVTDGYVERLNRLKPGRVDEIRALEASMDAYARYRRQHGLWNLMPGTPYRDINDQERRSTGWGDRVSQERFMGEGTPLGEAVRVWASGVPHATALLPLADPERVKMVFGRNGTQIIAAEADDNTREWMTACTDAQEIRNRGAILAEEFRGVIAKYAEENPDKLITMLSVAAGTLLPTLQAAINSGYDDRIRIVMLENSEPSIEMARHLVRELGFRGELDIRSVDVFDPRAMNQQLEELEGTAVTVDAVGIFEYVNEALREKMERRYGPDYMLFDPIAFFKTIQRFAQEEGKVVIGQMREDRPNGDFTRGVVGWPYIVERSPADLTRIMIDGGASKSDIKLSLTPKGVYTMATFTKPRLSRKLEPQSSNGNVVIVPGREDSRAPVTSAAARLIRSAAPELDGHINHAYPAHSGAERSPVHGPRHRVVDTLLNLFL